MTETAGDLVVGRWYTFHTTVAYPQLVRQGELLDVGLRTCRLRGPRRGPMYIVPRSFVIAELSLEDVI